MQFKARFILFTLKTVALLPLRVLYVFSDLLAGFLHTVIRYRRKVVHENLVSSFPEKSVGEIARIERRFYAFLTDYFVETIKMTGMSDGEMHRRLEVVNPEVVDRATSGGRNVTFYLGHYCNWEWCSSMPLHFNRGTFCMHVYHYLHDKAFDEVFLRIRDRFGSHSVEMADIMRRLIEYKRRGVPTVTGFIADQCPKMDIHLFTDFLNHDTGVYTGPERISKFLDSEVFFCHLSRPRRGYYRLKFVPITSNPKKEEIFAITRRYLDLLEENIREAPEYWLWSHRRWKRTRSDFMRHWGEEAGQKMLTHL